MSGPITCPYCRTSFAAENPAAVRAVCPRCGETVPVRPAEAGEPNAPPAAAPREILTSPRWFKPALFASSVFSVVVLLAGLWWVLSDSKRTNPTAREPDGVRPPIALAGLGYLPGSVQVIAAVRPGPLVALGHASKSDPRQRLADTGLPKSVLDTLDRLGVPLAQIDHVAVGLTAVPKSALPQAVVALVLNKPPADEAAIFRAVGAERVSGGDRPRYKATLGGFPVHLAKVGPTVYVFATEAHDLDGIETARPSNGDHLRPVLHETIVNRLSPASFAWAVAAGDDRWTDLDGVKLLAKVVKREDLLARFAPGRACAVGLSFEPDPVLRVAVKADDAQVIGDWFAQQLAGEGTEVETGDGWAAVTTPCPLSEVAAQLGRLIPPAKK